MQLFRGRAGLGAIVAGFAVGACSHRGQPERQRHASEAEALAAPLKART
jgi:hypothetical protein